MFVKNCFLLLPNPLQINYLSTRVCSTAMNELNVTLSEKSLKAIQLWAKLHLRESCNVSHNKS